MKIVSALIILFLAFGPGCGQKSAFEEISKYETKVQVIKTLEKDGLKFQVRVIPAAGIKYKHDGLNTLMFYHTDSCFKIRQSNGDRLSDITEPIANGIESNYEYLIYFNRIEGVDETFQFVYYDKYLSGKEFVFDFEK